MTQETALAARSQPALRLRTLGLAILVDGVRARVARWRERTSEAGDRTHAAWTHEPSLTASANPASQAPTQQESSHDGLDRPLRALTGTALVLGVIGTAVLYFGTTRFYQRLGVVPGEVGIEVQNLVPTTLVGLVLLIAIVVGVYGPPAILIPVGMRLIDGNLSVFGRRWLDLILGFVLAMGSFGVIAYAGVHWWISLISAGIVIAFVSATWRWPMAGRLLDFPGSATPIRWVVAGLVITAALALPAYYVMAVWPIEDSATVRKGEAVDSRPYSAWGAQVASVQRVDTGRQLVECGLYLGVAEGVVVVYVPQPQRQGHAARFPVTRVRVMVYPEQSECPIRANDRGR